MESSAGYRACVDGAKIGPPGVCVLQLGVPRVSTTLGKGYSLFLEICPLLKELGILEHWARGEDIKRVLDPEKVGIFGVKELKST